MEKFLSKILKVVTIILIIGILFNILEFDKISATTSASVYSVYTGENVYEYWKSTLNETEQEAYDILKDGYLKFSYRVYLNEVTTKEELDNAMSALKLDHPEMFWIKNYISLSVSKIFSTSIPIMLGYNCSKTEALETKQTIENTYQQIIDGASKYSSTYSKIKYVHDELLKIAEYEHYDKSEVYEYQSIISIFSEGKSVCAGYAYGFKLIMDNLGINTITVKYIDEEDDSNSHVWNMVQLNGKWYNLDVTWDDLSENSYKYFMITDSNFYTDHVKVENLPN